MKGMEEESNNPSLSSMSQLLVLAVTFEIEENFDFGPPSTSQDCQQQCSQQQGEKKEGFLQQQFVSKPHVSIAMVVASKKLGARRGFSGRKTREMKIEEGERG